MSMTTEQQQRLVRLGSHIKRIESDIPMARSGVESRKEEMWNVARDLFTLATAIGNRQSTGRDRGEYGSFARTAALAEKYAQVAADDDGDE